MSATQFALPLKEIVDCLDIVGLETLAWAFDYELYLMDGHEVKLPKVTFLKNGFDFHYKQIIFQA